MTNQDNVPANQNQERVFARNAVYGLAALVVLWALFNAPQGTHVNLAHFEGLFAALLGLARFLAVLTLVGAVFDGMRGRYARALERGLRGAVTLAVIGLLSGVPGVALVVVGLIGVVFAGYRVERRFSRG